MLSYIILFVFLQLIKFNFNEVYSKINFIKKIIKAAKVINRKIYNNLNFKTEYKWPLSLSIIKNEINMIFVIIKDKKFILHFYFKQRNDLLV